MRRVRSDVKPTVLATVLTRVLTVQPCACFTPGMTVTSRLTAFLKRSGWSTTRLASEASMHESTVSKLVRGDRPMTLESAVRIEVATVLAKTRGDLKCQPLRATDLLPEELADLLSVIAASPRTNSYAPKDK